MDRLTTNEKYPHGAEGISTDNLTGRYCRGAYEATAVTERLAEYENTGLTPEQIQEMDALYADMCQQVPRWIPVSERMPKNCEEVIASTEDDVQMMGYLKIRSGITVCESLPFVSRRVLAWMPLPKPYAPEGK